MASIRKRGASYFVEIARIGFPRQRKSFKSNAAAKAWARRIETSMDDGSWIDTSASDNESPLLDDILDEYLLSYKELGRTVAGPKKSSIEGLKEYFQGWSIHDIVKKDIVAFAKMRRKTVNHSTLQKQLTYLQAAVRRTKIKYKGREIEQAVKYLADEKLIGASHDRERRLLKDVPAKNDRPEIVGEYRRIKAAAGKHKWIMMAVDIAILTGMRMGEIHSLRISDGRALTAHTVPFGEGYIDLDQSLIGLWRKNKKHEKGKKFHIIPLWKSVRDVLLRAPNNFGKGERLFKIESASSIGDKFALVCQKAGIIGLTFHDLRHEATSRMFEPKSKGGRGMSAEQVIVVTSHASLDELQTYINLRAEDLLSEEDFDI